jgi:AbrB family looped-hinge helix DNA binding protein
MSDLSTTKMSSKGQVVIPEEIRNRLNLKPGSQFVVIGEKDTVVLKVITAPSMEDFDGLIAQARKNARIAGMKRSDITTTVTESRKRN